MKVTISPTLARPCRCSQVPSAKIAISVMVAAAPELRRDQLVHQGAQLARLGREPDEALDHEHVAERIADLLGERRVVCLDGALRAVRAAEHDQSQESDRGYQHDQQRAKPPVQEQRERQEHEKRCKGRKVLAQEREPQAEQGVGALPHDFELPARVRGSMKRARQPEHVLEILTHRGQPTALRESVGMQRDQNAGADAHDGDQPPDAEERERVPPGLLRRARRAAGKRVDDPPEQQRTDEGHAREGEIGQDQRDREALLRREQHQHSAIDLKEAHGGWRCGRQSHRTDRLLSRYGCKLLRILWAMAEGNSVSLRTMRRIRRGTWLSA
jgi:hypothetical protein